MNNFACPTDGSELRVQFHAERSKHSRSDLPYTAIVVARRSIDLVADVATVVISPNCATPIDVKAKNVLS